ncbi:MAG TPA: ATP-binding protein [Candidatus Limnocylindrales bacterium]
MTDRAPLASRIEQHALAEETATEPEIALDFDVPEEADDRRGLGIDLPFRTRLTVALVAASILPLAGFGLLLVAVGGIGTEAQTLGRLLLFAIALAAVLAILLAYLLIADLTGPLRAIGRAVDRVAAGDLGTPIDLPGEDELGRLAESHNRLAADLERRNRQLARILAAIETTSPRDGVDWLVGRAAADAREAFGLIDAEIRLGSPSAVPAEEVVPGEPRPVRATLQTGPDPTGVLVGHLPATGRWERADQDLLDLFAAQVAIAIRNAELFARVEAQNAQLIELDAAKDDFLRGVSHNLQTPLARIRAHAEQLDAVSPDRRLGIIAEQTDRLSRMVRQLLTVTRLESGALRPQPEVLSLAARVRRAWEALAAADVSFSLADDAEGWLAIGDADQLDQVLWALLDNGVKYGHGTPIEATVRLEVDRRRLRLTIADHGRGVPEEDRARLFGRFERGSDVAPDEGSGLGLYVSRELCRAMGGDLVLEPSARAPGAAFTIVLPAEAPEET